MCVLVVLGCVVVVVVVVVDEVVVVVGDVVVVVVVCACEGDFFFFGFAGALFFFFFAGVVVDAELVVVDATAATDAVVVELEPHAAKPSASGTATRTATPVRVFTTNRLTVRPDSQRPGDPVRLVIDVNVS